MTRLSYAWSKHMPLLPRRSKRWIVTSNPLPTTLPTIGMRLKTKAAADMDAWNAKIEQLKHDRGVIRADNHAERLEWEASFAVDYAVAAIDQANSSCARCYRRPHRGRQNQSTPKPRPMLAATPRHAHAVLFIENTVQAGVQLLAMIVARGLSSFIGAWWSAFRWRTSSRRTTCLPCMSGRVMWSAC